MTLRLVRMAPPDVPWAELDRRGDRSVFQTREWLDVLWATQRVEPVVAAVTEGGDPVGWFTGGVVRRAGLRVLGSPLPGWGTSYMGFTLDDRGRTMEALPALRRFAVRHLGCVHLEVMDRAGRTASAPGGWRWFELPGHELDLVRDAAPRRDEELLAGMSSMARRNVRRSGRVGVRVEPVSDDPVDRRRFADDTARLVAWVAATRGAQPAFGPERVEAVLRHLQPAGNVVALRALAPDGECVAVGVFPGLAGGTAVLWTVAGDTRARDLRANEAVVWAALRAWRDRGARVLDFGGGGGLTDYKAKFGGRPISVPWWRWSAVPGSERIRSVVARRAGRSRLSGVLADGSRGAGHHEQRVG